MKNDSHPVMNKSNILRAVQKVVPTASRLVRYIKLLGKICVVYIVTTSDDMFVTCSAF